MYSFLGLITLGNHSFLPGAAPPSSIVSGLSQAGEVRQPRDWETSCRQNEDSGFVKPEGWGSITPFFYSPPSPSLRAPLWPCLSKVIPPLRNLTCHWLTSQAWGQAGWSKREPEVAPCQGDKLCLLSGLRSQGLLLSLSHGGLKLLNQAGRFPTNKHCKYAWKIMENGKPQQINILCQDETNGHFRTKKYII